MLDVNTFVEDDLTSLQHDMFLLNVSVGSLFLQHTSSGIRFSASRMELFNSLHDHLWSVCRDLDMLGKLGFSLQDVAHKMSNDVDDWRKL